MKKINLAMLEDGRIGLSPRMGGFLAEAASVCFHHSGHPIVFNLPSRGHYEEVYEVTCTDLHSNSLGSFGDIQESTEYGACGVALSIVNVETPLLTRRSWKGTGFDYWLGTSEEGYPFQNAARLEVSGIISGTEAQADKRLSEKLGQMTVSDDMGLPAIAIVVEFANPLTSTGKR